MLLVMIECAVNKIDDLLASINTCVEYTVRELVCIDERYASMRLEVQQSVEESCAHIEKKKNESVKVRTLRINDLMQKCQDYAASIEKLNFDAANKSKAYQKHCVEFEIANPSYPSCSITQLDQCQTRLGEILDNARGMHRQIVNAGSLGSLFGAVKGETKRRYEELYRAYKESVDVLNRARSLAFELELTGSQKDQQLAATELSQVNEESKALYQKIDARNSQDIEICIECLLAKLDALFPAEEIATLVEQERLLFPRPGVRVTGQSRFLALGEYAYTLSSWPFGSHRDELEQALGHYFGPWYQAGSLALPAITDRASAASVVILGDSLESCSALNWLVASVLETNEVPHQTFIFINPSGDRVFFKPFLKAIKHCPQVFGERIITDRKSMTEALEEVASIIVERNQKTLIEYANIFDFNDASETATLPLVTIAMAASIDELSKSDIDQIKSIIRNGSFCGVGIFLALDTKGASEEDIEKLKPVFDRAITGYTIAGGTRIALSNAVSLLYETVSTDRIESDLAIVQEGLKSQLTQNISLESVLPRDSWFTGSTLRGLEIPMGKAPDGRSVALEFGPEVSNGISHFGLMIGATGSGKSSLLHSLILSALLKYGPDELELYLLDFKSGVEFDLYSKFRIPQLKLLALDAMQAFGLSILSELKQRMEERNRLFKDEGVQNIEEYRHSTGKAMPRILVLMDEFQVLFNEDHDRRVANEAAILLADFISLARNCGIHFLLSTQTFSRLRSGNFSVNQSTLDEMHVRIGLQCSLNEAEKLFGTDYGSQAHGLMGSQKGSGVITENDLVLPPEAFRSVFCEKGERHELLEAVEKHYEATAVVESTRIFRSDTVPDLRDVFDSGDNSDASGGNEMLLYLGEPLKIGEPIKIHFNRRLRSTLLIVGSNVKMLDDLIAAYIYSALRYEDINTGFSASTASEGPGAIYLWDGRSLVDEPWSEAMLRVCSDRNDVMNVAEENYQILQHLDELYGEFVARQAGESPSQKPVHLIINEYQWIDAFLAVLDRRDKQYEPVTEPQGLAGNSIDSVLDGLMMGTTNSVSSRLEKFHQLVQRGYLYGINVVVATTDFVSVREKLMQVLPNLQNRIVFGLSGTDADWLIRGALGQMETLRPNMALFSNGRNGPEIFRPYRISTT